MMRPKKHRGLKIQDGQQVAGWQHIHDLGIFNPTYHERSADLHYVRRFIVSDAEKGVQRVLDVGAGQAKIAAGVKHPNIKIYLLEPTELMIWQRWKGWKNWLSRAIQLGKTGTESPPYPMARGWKNWLSRAIQLGRIGTEGPPYPVVRAIGERIPFPDESFDKVLITYTLEYTNRNNTIAEIRRVLKKKGKALVLLHKPNSYYQRSIKYGYTINKAHIAMLLNVKAGRYGGFEEFNRDARSTGFDQHPEYPQMREIMVGWSNTIRTADKPEKEAIKRAIAGTIKDIEDKVRPFDKMSISDKRLFRDENAAKQFFQGKGFNVLDVQTITDPKNGELGYAVILEKTA